MSSPMKHVVVVQSYFICDTAKEATRLRDVLEECMVVTAKVSNSCGVGTIHIEEMSPDALKVPTSASTAVN